MPKVDDKEMQELVDALNSVSGVETVDCCFGHPEEPERTCNHHSYAFVGMTIDKSSRKFAKSFAKEFNRVKYPDGGWAHISLVQFVGRYPDNFYRIEISPCNNPAFNVKGRQEKKKAIAMIVEWIHQNWKSNQWLQ